MRLSVINIVMSRYLLFINIIIQLPCAGSGVVRMDPLRFLAGCCTRRLNQALTVFLLM